MKRKVIMSKAYLKCICLIGLLFIMFGFETTTAKAADTKVTGVTATASQEFWPAKDAVDDISEETWWKTNVAGECWLQLTFDKVYYIDRWYVVNYGYFSYDGNDFRAQNTRDYKLQSSMNGTTWTDRDVVEDNTENITNRTVTPFTAKYVRIYITHPVQDESSITGCGAIVDFEVFATAPVVASVEVPAIAKYTVGQNLTFTVNYSAQVTVTGTPYLPVAIGTKTVNAVYNSGSGSSALTFRYTVQSGDYDVDGITLGGVNANGGTIKDNVSNNANGLLNNVGITSGITVDARVLRNISISSSLDGGNITSSKTSEYAGESITLTITPASGKQLKEGSLKYNDSTKDVAIIGNTFAMPDANITISAEFENIPPTVYSVTVGTLDGGSVEASPNSAVAGSNIALTITPANGKQLKTGSLKYNDGTKDVAINGSSFTMPEANVTIMAEFETKPPTVYSVSVGPLNGGSVAASPNSAVAGSNITLTITPESGKQLKVGSLKYNDGTKDVAINGSSFTMPDANVTITVEFETIPPTVYSITVGTLDGGSVVATPSSAVAGSNIALTITPASGKQLKAGSLKYNDGTKDVAINGSSFTMPDANVTITAEFETKPPTVYSVTVGPVNGGSVAASPNSAVAGSNIELTITPANGKQLKAGSLKYNDGAKDVAINGSSFTMPDANVTITAEFENIPPTVYIVTVGPLNGGSIAASPNSAVAGSNITLTITPESGKQLKVGSLKYNDGTKDVAINGSSFTMPDANVTVTAEFEDIPIIPVPTYAVKIETLTGGSIIANQITAVSGSSIILTIIPDTGKLLKVGSLKYNDGTKDVTISGNSFVMPEANITITAEFENVPVSSTDTNLLNIVTPKSITGLVNGTAKSVAAFGLPATITIITSGGNSSASVVWDVASCAYDQNSLNAQSFTVTGMLTLPSGVVNTNNINLSVTISVSVNQSTNSGSGTGVIIPTTNAEPKLPSVEGSKAKGWDSVIEYITDNNTGSITVNMNGSTTATPDVFNAIKGKDIKLTLDLGKGIQWTINGTDIPKSMDSTKLHGIDLNLSMNTDRIPAELLSNLPDTDKVQISLAYEGSFGFTATLRVPLNAKNSGKVANLFYYNPVKNQLELQAVGVVDKKGNVEFPFTHASDYVIVMSNTAMLEDEIDAITVTPVKKTLYIGGTKRKSVTIKTIIPEVVQKAVADGLCDMKITYKSSKPKVATVSKSGKIIAKKAGATTITTTITINGVKKSFQTTIKVKKTTD